MPADPPTMAHIVGRSKTRSDSCDRFFIPQSRWQFPKSNDIEDSRIASKQLTASMKDLSILSNPHPHLPGKPIRPKSMCIPDSRYIEQDDNNFFDDKIPNFDSNYFLDGDGFESMMDNNALAGFGNNTYEMKNLKKEHHIPRNPVQRAASRLYSVGNGVPPTRNETNRKCVGPEFVVRASLPSKRLVVTQSKPNKKSVAIILLDGQKLKVFCGLRSTTAGQLLELIIQEQHIEENFMLGLSALIAGDFVFIPQDTRICKVMSSGNNSSESLTLYLRVRFFLPSLRAIKGNQIRHLLYLQLRRSILEHQLPSSFSQIIELNGLALQAEFGNFEELEHGTRDYFLLEHYVPETMTCIVDDENYLKKELVKAHISKKGLGREQAEENFIIFTQNLPHYGGHFYTAVWVLKNNSKKDIWLCISPRGINLYERGKSTSCYGPQLYQTFEWKRIQTICYSKHFLYILPDSGGRQRKDIKRYKLKMDHKKSYFAFRLACVHHQFFLRLRREQTSLHSLNQQFGIELKSVESETDSPCKLGAHKKRVYSEAEECDIPMDPYKEYKTDFKAPIRYVLNERSEQPHYRRTRSVHDLTNIKDRGVNEEQQNKDNEKPELTYQCGLGMESLFFAGLPNGLEKRRGVKMGTRAFSKISTRASRSVETVNDQEYLEQISLGSSSFHCSSPSRTSLDDLEDSAGDAYVLDTTLKSVSQQNFLPNFQETINKTLLDRLNDMSFAEERVLSAVTVERDCQSSLGLQITEGSDGNMYVQSVITGGSAYLTKRIMKGDQVIAVNGQSLLGRKYSESLEILKNTIGKVEFVISRVVATYTGPSTGPSIGGTLRSDIEDYSNVKSIDLSKLQDRSLVETKLDSCRSMSNSDKYINRSPIKEDLSYYMKCQQQHRVPQLGNYTVVESTYLREKYTNVSDDLPKLPSDSNKAIIVDMIPKKKFDWAAADFDNNLAITSTLLPLRKAVNNSTKADIASILDNNIDDKQLKREQLVALPRSLGLSRKWKGPVRYPVTPVKKTADYEVAGTSDEEQVFI